MNLIFGFIIKAILLLFLSHSALCAIKLLVSAIIQIAAVLSIQSTYILKCIISPWYLFYLFIFQGCGYAIEG